MNRAQALVYAVGFALGRAWRFVRRLVMVPLAPVAFLYGRARRAVAPLVCRRFGHRPERRGTVRVRGWRPAVYVVCSRCGAEWRGVKP
jgi:hypothetical protein